MATCSSPNRATAIDACLRRPRILSTEAAAPLSTKDAPAWVTTALIAPGASPTAGLLATLVSIRWPRRCCAWLLEGLERDTRVRALAIREADFASATSHGVGVNVDAPVPAELPAEEDQRKATIAPVPPMHVTVPLLAAQLIS
jgi:hypothetical protein